MSVQIIIHGEHATDALAELQNIAQALTGASPKNEAGAASGLKGSTNSAPSTPAPKASTEAQTTGGKTDTKLGREEQDAAVEEMIEAGKKDDRYDLLTKGRQKNVDDGIAAKSESKKNDDLGSMFDDDEKVTADMVRDMMAKLGKDAEGNPIQENLVKIKGVLTKYVPKGEEVKVGKIPADKLAAAYAELKKMEA